MAKKTAAPAAPEDDMNDSERYERHKMIAKIEGDLPYDKDAYVSIARRALNRAAVAIIEAGSALLVIKEREGRGDFMRIVEQELSIPYTTAQRFMNTALKATMFPNIASQLPKLGNLTNVYTLLEAPEEDLKELETKGILAGKDMDELAAMSVKQMRECIKSLKTEIKTAEKSAEEKYQAIASALEAENEAYRAYAKTMPENKELDKRLGFALGHLESFIGAMSGCAFQVVEVEDMNAASKIESFISRAHSLIVHFAEKWEAHKRGDVGDAL